MSRHRLLVVSDLALVAEAVRAALSDHGFDARPIPWTGGTTALPLTQPEPRLGLMISDLSTFGALRSGQDIVRRTPVSWLLLTGAPRGVIWGAMLESGVDAILDSGASLAETAYALGRLADGEGRMSGAARDALVRRWQVESAEREQAADRIHSLTPREQTVLRLLFGGYKVAAIAILLGISESTVRTHVRAILRKLRVSSQLAAVAAYGWLDEERAGR